MNLDDAMEACDDVRLDAMAQGEISTPTDILLLSAMVRGIQMIERLLDSPPECKEDR